MTAFVHIVQEGLAFALYTFGVFVALIPYGFALLAPSRTWTLKGVATPDGLFLRFDFFLPLLLWMLAGTWTAHFFFSSSWAATSLVTLLGPVAVLGLTVGLVWWKIR